MANAFDKQGASRPHIYQVIQYNSASIGTTKFGAGTQQIRVMRQLGGWGTINDTTNDSVIATSAGGVGMFITGISTGTPAAATAATGSPYPEYFAVTPGQIFFFSSTSTSTGAISITEMA